MKICHENKPKRKCSILWTKTRFFNSRSNLYNRSIRSHLPYSSNRFPSWGQRSEPDWPDSFWPERGPSAAFGCRQVRSENRSCIRFLHHRTCSSIMKPWSGRRKRPKLQKNESTSSSRYRSRSKRNMEKCHAQRDKIPGGGTTIKRNSQIGGHKAE